MASEDFRPTLGRWFNKEKSPGKWAKAPAYYSGFTYSDFTYGTDHKESEGFVTETQLQVSIICSKTTQALAIDVDYPDRLPESATGQLVTAQNAISMHGTHFHILVDMRGVSEAEWPQQGRAPWGDIKSSGFIPLPSSQHWSGDYYVAAPNWQTRIIKATPELIAALKTDRFAYADKRLAQARVNNPRQAHVMTADGNKVWASGYVENVWGQLPDGFLTHDDELKDLVCDMGTRGHDHDSVLDEWRRLAGADDAGHPWTDKDFERHWRMIPAKWAAILEEAEEDEAGWQAFTNTDKKYADLKRARDLINEQAAQMPYTDEDPITPDPEALLAEKSKAPAPRAPSDRRATVQDQAAWIGGFPFEPQGFADAELAELLLQRIYPIARYCIMQDTWIGRQLNHWELYPVDFAEGLVNIPVALGLMPKGMSKEMLKREDIDPDGEKARDLLRQWTTYLKFANSAEAGKIARKVKAILRSPIAHPLSEDMLNMDTDPEEFWAGGVCWDLRKSADVLMPRESISNRVHLHSAAVRPDLECPTPLWDDLLDAIWPPERLSDGREVRDLQDWALTVLSAGLTGYPKKVVPVLQGGTNRGKSTVIDAMADVLGTYFKPINPKVLDATASTHDTVLMELMGARMVFLDEGVSRGKMSTARLKRLAGGSSITANRMRKDPITFRPTHTLAIALNPEESISFEDPAIESRIRFLPCEGDPAEVIKVAEQLDYFRSPAWLAERPGVLAKLIQRAARMLADEQSLTKERAPLSSKLAEQEAKEAEDDVLRWFLEATADCPEGFPARDLFIAFREWTRETKGDRGFVPSEKSWGLRMNQLVPEDASHPLRSAAGKKRRRKPLPPGYAGFAGSAPVPTVKAFMQEQGSGVSRPDRAGSEPDRAGTENDPTSPLTRDNVGCVGSVYTNTTYPHTHTYAREESENVPAPCTPCTDTPWDDYAYRSDLELGRGVPLALDPAISPWPPAPAIENPPSGQITPGQQNQDPPSGAKTPEPANELPKPPKAPRVTMTPEERLERAAAKKQEIARLRAEKLSAALLEAGGPIVTLPALVLRDQTIIPVTSQQAWDFLEPMFAEISVDVEHTGYAIGHENYALRLVQLGNESAAVVLDPSNETQADLIREVLLRSGTLHAHSALADLIPLEHAGLCDVSAWDRMDDTVIKAKLTDPKLTDSDESGLKPLAKALLGPDYSLAWKCDQLKSEICKTQTWITETKTDTPIEKSGWAMMPFCEAFVRYAASDVMDCSAVSRVLDERNPIAPELLKREQQFMKAFRPIALAGTPLDAPHVRELIEQHTRERENARLRVQEATGGAVTNPKSTTEVPKALIALGYDLPRTKPTKSKPEGGLSAAKGVLEPFAGNILEARELYQAGEMTIQELTDVEQRNDPLCADILEYRKHDTALGLLLNPWNELCERGDGRIRSNIMTIEARTGRTSSRNFNMQQVSRRGGMRACILPEPGTRGISADFNSVEIRVGSAVSGDEQMQWLIAQSDLYPDRKKEFDFHWRTAITCYGESATKENRYNSKRINFAKMFGSGKQSCADLVGVPVHEVGMAFDAFSAIAPQYEEWDRKMREFVRFGGRSVEAYSGRPLWMDASAEHGAGNTVIQGTARELAVDATLRWAAGPWGHLTILIVHDELCVFNVPEAEAEAALAFLIECMQTEIFGVAIKAEANPIWEAWPDAS